MLLRTARRVVVCCFVLFTPTIFLLLSLPPPCLYCVDCVNRLRKKKLYLPADWWHLKCRTFIRRGMRAEAKEEITCAFYLHLYSCACFWCWLYRLAMLTKSSKSWEMPIYSSRQLMFALVSHVLLVIHMKSGTLQVGPFSTCSKKHSQTLFYTLILWVKLIELHRKL